VPPATFFTSNQNNKKQRAQTRHEKTTNPALVPAYGGTPRSAAD
jgi:hypothetical protein